MNAIYDMVGIGFGPSNLALAAIVDEQQTDNISAIFLEKKSDFNWHANMLLDGAEMQISFLKDIATLRNPSSPFTFLNYLHNVGRLDLFTNLRNFYPSRIEFNDYFRWVADQLKKYVKYSCDVIDIIPYEGDPHNVLEIIYQECDAENNVIVSSLLARNIIVATGGEAKIPQNVKINTDSQRIWHASHYLEKINQYKSSANHKYHFCVIGSGQSAAEITYDLHQSFPSSTVMCMYSGFGLKVSDDSEFINELFLPASVDLFYKASEDIRKKINEAHRDTNYAVVDAELIQKLYRIKYEETVTGKQRLQFNRFSTIESVTETDLDVEIEFTNSLAKSMLNHLHVDALILATGYTHSIPPFVLRNLVEYFRLTPSGLPSVTRHHQIETVSQFKAGIFLQGYNQHSHGLSDTLLSVSSIRAKDIFDQIVYKDKGKDKIYQVENRKVGMSLTA